MVSKTCLTDQNAPASDEAGVFYYDTIRIIDVTEHFFLFFPFFVMFLMKIYEVFIRNITKNFMKKENNQC